MPRLRLLIAAALLALVAPAAAHAEPRLLLDATTVLDGALTAPAGADSGACHRAYRPGSPGVATRDAQLSGPGSLEVHLAGGEGDWDVAVFDAAGGLLAADASPDAQEVASGFALTGGTVHVQACRRSGDAASVPATLEHSAIAPGAAEAAKADPPQLVDVITPTRETRQRVVDLGLDLTEHGGRESLGVVLHDDADREKLRKAGLRWLVKVPDLVAQDRAARASERQAAARTPGARASALPSGRERYRVLADYNNELKDLAAKNPGLVKLFTLPNKTYGGKDVLGIEIAENVNRNDGRPAFFNMGIHHAREWPSGELTMEWAIELVNGFKKGDARATRIVRNSRNIVVPVVNPDGFEASRTAGEIAGQGGGRNEAVPDTAYIVGGAATGGEYRRKNCRLPDDSAAGNCTTSAGLAENGVDPNRNYGGLWGGPGADGTNRLAQTYRGPAPFSEPETKNIQSVVSRHQVTTLISNHTTAALVLRAPGLQVLGDPIDENRGYKALGDDMAKHNGYFSQKSFELYDTTGTTEDWSYNATGGFGFTFEIYCGAPNYETGDCDDPAFHPTFQRVVEEWDGTNPVADHANDPGPNKGFDGKGNREAYYIAAESTLDEQRHSVLEGSAPPGTTLRLRKTFKTQTFPQDQPDGSEKPLEFDDTLETTYDVGDDARVRWHVNPSTRPIVAKSTGAENPGKSSPPEPDRQGGPTGTADDPSDDGQAQPFPNANSNNPAHYNDHPITIPSNGDNGFMTAKIEWATPTSDWDARLYEDRNGNGKSENDEPVVSSSQTGLDGGTGVSEEVTIAGQPRLRAGAKYVLRVNNFAATEPYTLKISYAQPLPFKPGQVESYTLTCERDGRVFQTQQVIVDRGEVKQLDLRACAAAIQRACAANTIGLRSVSAKPRGAGVRFGFRRFARRPVRIDVFQVSSGRRVIDERLVARFKGRNKAKTWNGRGARGDGYYFARYRMRTRGKRSETRRVTLVRRNGRFSRRPDFYRRATCDLLPSFKLERAVFGGVQGTPLRIAFQVATRARVQVTVLRGKKAVKRFKARAFRAERTHRLRVGAAKLRRRGDYRVRITVGRGAGRVVSTLVSRRL